MSIANTIRCCLFVLALCSLAHALPPESNSHQAPLSAVASRDNVKYVDANRILMFVTNHGNFGRDLADVFGNDFGTYFPYSGTSYILDGSNTRSPLYAGGLWIGGVDSASGDTLLCLSEYASEYVPGPMLHGTFQTDRPEYRVYKLYRDSLADNPNQDYLDWPVDQGAPLDRHGLPAMLGDQMCWAVYNDANPSGHNGRVDAGETDPIGLEVKQTVFAYDRYGSLGDVVYLLYVVTNKGGKTLNDCFMSFWVDPDLGAPGDDLVGCDTLANIIFCYNGSNTDSRYTPMPPPACGFKLLAGPLVASPGDTATFCGVPLSDYRNQGMSAFVKYINGTDPDHYSATYAYMKGLDALNGNAPRVFNGDTLAFWYSGNPVTGTGDLDSDYQDCRMMASYGPFDFRPGDSQQLVIKFAVGAGTNRLNSISVLKETLNSNTEIPTAVPGQPQSGLPTGFNVAQNYPNPFNPETTIEFTLPARAAVIVDIVNVLGQTVRNMSLGELSAGEHSVRWNGRNDGGADVASGVYFYRVSAGDYTSSRKMVLVR